MPEIEPTGEDYENELPEVEDESSRVKNEQSARPFFALLSFLMAAICLAIFLTRPLDAITGLVILFGVLIFGMGGILILERKPSQQRSASPSLYRRDSQNGATIVESTLTDANQEDEEEAEDETLSPFEMLVEDALSSIPFEFQEKMANLAILVEREPGEEVLKRVGVKNGHTLLGLYQGVPLTAQGHSGAILPESIIIYQQAIEDYCHGDPDRIRDQVRSTVLHEVAHHFGMDHQEMPIWVK